MIAVFSSLLIGTLTPAFAQVGDAKPRKSEWTTETAPKEKVIQIAPSTTNTASEVQPSVPPTGEATYVDDRIIVKYKQGFTSPKTSILSSSALKNSVKLSSIDAEVVELSTTENVEQLITKLNNDPNVLYAEPDHKLYKASSSDIPNDTYFTDQWALLNTGQDPGLHGDPGVPGVDIKATDAWGITKGSSDLVVAVIDTGIQIDHPDLIHNIWTNPLDTSNTLDDDNNGYIDDVHGWNFLSDNNQLYSALDGDWHGTSIAGIIAASTNNGIGVAGIAPNVKIMPLKFIGAEYGYETDLIEAIAYAEEHGAKIANISADMINPSQALKDAIDASSMLFVTSAGNYGQNSDENPTYPASYNSPNIISVAALDHKGLLLTSSNYGSTSIDVAAPGLSLMSTYPVENPGLAAEIDTGVYKAIFNGIAFENFSKTADRKDAFDKALNYLGASKSDSSAKILLVQDDLSNFLPYGSSSKLSTYTSLLADYTGFDIAEDLILTGPNGDAGDGPSIEQMQDYDVVVWFTGSASRKNIKNLTDNDQANLTAYLNGGGHLLLTGSYPLFNDSDSSFVNDVLHLYYVSQKGNTPVVGLPGTIYEGVSYQSTGGNWIISRDPAIAKINLQYINPVEKSYFEVSGTSFAAAQASGVAALVLSQEPTLSAIAMKQRILNSGTRLSSLAGKVASGKLLNAYQALSDDEIPGTPFSNGTVNNGLDETTDMNDVYALELTAGEKLHLALSGDDNTDFDLYLYPPTATTINAIKGSVAESENEETSTESIEYVVPTSGTYYVDVYAFGGSGSYTLTSISDKTDKYSGYYEDDSSALALAFAGSWTQISDAAYSGETAKELNEAGTVNFTFVGNYISWLASKNNKQGIANVYIDDVLVASPSLYSKSPLNKQIIFEKSVPYGQHTISIEWTGNLDPNGKKTSTFINVDAFSIAQLMQNDALSATFIGAWTTNYSLKNLGGSARYADVTGSYAQFKFSGTNVQLLAFTGANCGKANVYIDDVLVTTEPIDMYSAKTNFRTIVFESAPLSPGTHTLKVVNSGEKNTLSSGTNISVDAISIIQ